MHPWPLPTGASSSVPTLTVGTTRMSPDVATCRLEGKPAPGWEPLSQAVCELLADPQGPALPAPWFLKPTGFSGSPLLSVTRDLTETHLLCHKGNEEQTLLTKESKSIFTIKAGLYSSGNKLQIVTVGNCSVLLQLSWRNCRHRILYPLAHVLWEMVLPSSSQNKQTNKQTNKRMNSRQF